MSTKTQQLTIESAKFFREWVVAANAKESELIEFWSNQKKYTELILGDGSPEAMTKAVGKALGLEVYSRNYYSTDAIFYRNEGLVPGAKIGQTWFRDIAIAFEHENYFNDKLYEEVSHLLIVNCELRVLVAYPYGDVDKVMTHLHEIIRGSKLANHLSDNCNFLIIFGYRNPFKWHGLVYRNEGWFDVTCIER